MFRPLRHVVLHALLAAVLLFAQQIGMAHMVAHGSGHGRAHSHSEGVPTQVCDECLAFAQVEPAPVAVPVLFAGHSRLAADPAVRWRSTTPPFLNAFRSRVPPPIFR